MLFAVAWLLLRGKIGRSLRAVRDSELAAASSGVNLARYKTLAFGISAFYAGVAGSLLAIATTFVNPDTFPVTLSIFLLVGVVVGGLGSLWPLVFGAIFIQFLPLWAQDGARRRRGAGGRLRRRPDPRHVRPAGRRRRPDPASPDAYNSRLPSRSLEPFSTSRSCTDDASPETRCSPCSPSRCVIATGASAATQRRSRRDREDDPRSAARRRSPGTASAYASVARGANAYFKYVNARGGVNGRTITYKTVDDAYDPAKTVQATRQLVEQDKVFAIFNSLGTEQNVATRDYLNAQKVPQLFVASGATTFGRDFKEYPWTIGFQPSYQRRGLDLRQVPRPLEAGRQGRRPLPERRLRQGPAGAASSRGSRARR